MLLRTLFVAAAAVQLTVPSAQAILKQYRLRLTQIDISSNLSPQVLYLPDRILPQKSYSIVDEPGDGSPTLKKLRILGDKTGTLQVPQLGGFIFVSQNWTEGPTGDFTGTGSTDTTIAWGLVTGWTVTGSTFCHASPGFICDFELVQDATVDKNIYSSFFDLGTWTFHGTGFTATPFINRTNEPGAGNTLHWIGGTLSTDGRIPALPLLGLAVLGSSLVAGGLAALRSGRR